MMNTAEEIKGLRRGDIVRHKSGNTYVVVAHTPNGWPIAARQLTVTNPIEWAVVFRIGVGADVETALDGLLAFIRGEGPFAMLGPGLHTYPDRDDDGKHAGCLELERRGLIYRHLDEPGNVVWMPVEDIIRDQIAPCGQCGRQVLLSNAGTFVTHWPPDGHHACPNSGRPPV